MTTDTSAPPDQLEAILGGEPPGNPPPETAASRRKGGRPSQQAAVAEPPRAAAAEIDPDAPMKEPRELVTFWPRIIRRAIDEQRVGTDYIVISAQRILLDRAVRSESPSISPITGSSVDGSGDPGYVGAGEDLVDLIESCWHIAPQIDCAARYKVRFAYKSLSGLTNARHTYIDTCDIVLPPYKELVLTRKAMESRQRVRSAWQHHGEGEGGGVESPQPAYLPQPRRYEVPRMHASPHAPAHAQPPTGSGSDEDLRVEVARLTTVLEERERVRIAGGDRIPAPAATGPAPMSQEEQDARLARIVATAVAQTLPSVLTQMGFRPQPEGAAAAAARPPVDEDAQFGKLLDRLASLRKFDDQMRAHYTPEDDDEPVRAAPAAAGAAGVPEATAIPIDDPYKMREVPVVKYKGQQPIFFREKRPDEDWGKYLLEVGIHNPVMARDMALKVLDETAAGELLRKLAGMVTDSKAIPTTGTPVAENGAGAAAAPAAGAWTPRAS